MTPDEKKQFAKELKGSTSLVYERDLSNDQLKIFISLLDGYSYEQLSAALTKHCQTNKFSPKPADLIQIINGGTDQLKDKAAQFWQKLVWMVSHGQSACAVQSEDWRAQVALREYWSAICTASVTSQKALDDLKYDVVRAYVQASRENAVTGFTASSIATGRQDLILIHSDTTKTPQKITQNGNLLISKDQYAALTNETKLIGDSNE